MSGYSYHWPRGSSQMLRDVSFTCPACEDGTWTITLDMDGNERGSAEIECSASLDCKKAYFDGRYFDALADAIEEADRIEANGPTDEQLASQADGPSAADTQHRMAEARRLK